MNRHRGRPGRLDVDHIACTAEGLCADLLPELVELDDWGYPVVSREPVPGTLLRRARAAVAACPRLALTLSTPPAPRPGRPRR